MIRRPPGPDPPARIVRSCRPGPGIHPGSPSVRIDGPTCHDRGGISPDNRTGGERAPPPKTGRESRARRPYKTHGGSVAPEQNPDQPERQQPEDAQPASEQPKPGGNPGGAAPDAEGEVIVPDTIEELELLEEPVRPIVRPTWPSSWPSVPRTCSAWARSTPTTSAESTGTAPRPDRPASNRSSTTCCRCSTASLPPVSTRANSPAASSCWPMNWRSWRPSTAWSPTRPRASPSTRRSMTR